MEELDLLLGAGLDHRAGREEETAGSDRCGQGLKRILFIDSTQSKGAGQDGPGAGATRSARTRNSGPRGRACRARDTLSRWGGRGR